MAYVKKDWQDLPSQTTPVTADDLDRIENGIYNNDIKLNVDDSFDSDYDINVIKSKNIFNRDTAKPYYWLSATGVISSNTDPVLISDFIKVENGQQYTLSGIPDTYPIRVCSYTDTNTFKTCLINYVTDTKTFTADADYIVFAIGIPTGGNATTLPSIQLEKGSSSSPYEPYYLKNIFAGEKQIFPKYSETMYANDFKCKNLFNKDIVTLNSYVKSSDGTVASNTGFFCSEYIEVKPNTTYYWNDTQLRGNTGAYYDSSKTYISGISSSDLGVYYFTTPANCKYIRLNGVSSVINNYQLEIGTEQTAYTPYKNFDNTPNVIVISRNGNEDINITTAYQHKIVSLDTIVTKIGNKLTYNGTNKSIVIGSDVHHIEVSACVVMSHSSSSVTDRYFSIRKNSNDFVSSVYQYLNIPANYTYVLNIPSIIIDVNEDDEIYATVTSGITETISIKGSTIKRVFLTVKVVD